MNNNHMFTKHTTERLSLDPLNAADADFIFELLNTKGWLQFIGDRNVHSKEDAIKYINKVSTTPNFYYWTVRRSGNVEPIGIISFIKRNYLEHFDIGFAFLPQHNGRGYAYEAAKKILSVVSSKPEYSTVVATTLAHNASSIKLLQKLGFHFEKEMEVGRERLQIFSNAEG
jgi:ribosomal-protein-alanine N-acetyltransferase